MNTFPMIRSCCRYLDNIVLRPTATLSLSTYNRNNGTCSEQKSISISTGFTMLKGTMILAGTTVAVCTMLRFLHRKKRKKSLCSKKFTSSSAKKVTKP